MVEMLDMDDENFKGKLHFEIMSMGGSTDYRNDRDRPYNGQPQTDQGERGKTEIKGLTMRDIMDCFVKGFLLGCADHEAYEKAENGTWRYRDVYEVKEADFDPIAIGQAMTCEIEKMMGIYPNVPEAVHKQITEELFGKEENDDPNP